MIPKDNNTNLYVENENFDHFEHTLIRLEEHPGRFQIHYLFGGLRQGQRLVAGWWLHCSYESSVKVQGLLQRWWYLLMKLCEALLTWMHQLDNLNKVRSLIRSYYMFIIHYNYTLIVRNAHKWDGLPMSNLLRYWCYQSCFSCLVGHQLSNKIPPQKCLQTY